jgi:putative NADH-flavin reductase
MQQPATIAVIGGTGKSGKYLVQTLLQQGHQLKLLVRNPEKAPANHPQVSIIPGNVTDYNAVQALITGTQAVVSTLGLGIPASAPGIFSQSTMHVIQAMQVCNVRRYIVTTGLNVATPFDKKDAPTQQATDWMKTTYPASTANKQLEYELLTGSTLDWTLVRLPMIQLTDKRGKIATSLENCLGNSISATDLAHFLVAQLIATAFIRQAPFVANV